MESSGHDLPGFRRFIAVPAKTNVLCVLAAYLVGGLEGHSYPKLYSPDGVDIEATTRSAVANTGIRRGIEGHAEIGGFARWGEGERIDADSPILPQAIAA